MNIINILENGELFFAEDAVESKKIKSQIQAVNKCFADMSEAIRAFAEFANSQLKGEYHHKLVMTKSLKEHFTSWQAVSLAYDAVSKEESKEIEKYNACKAKLVTSLKNLQKESTKEAVVSLYDLFEGEFQKCEEGHEVIILGSHGDQIIETIIAQVEEGLVVSGHYDEIEPTTLEANYSKVQENVSMCKAQAQELYGSKPGKLAKIDMSIATMEEVGKKVVFFETYKNELLNIGCNPKFIKDYEKNFTKQYIPLKKSLQKDLRIEFVDICDIIVDEATYPASDLENPRDTQEVVAEAEQIEEIVEEVVEPAEETIEPAVKEIETVDTDADTTVVTDTNIDDIE